MFSDCILENNKENLIEYFNGIFTVSVVSFLFREIEKKNSIA